MRTPEDEVEVDEEVDDDDADDNLDDAADASTVNATGSPETAIEGPRARRAPGGERALLKGALLGRYVILERIGAGGMGVVYAAYDPDLNRKVAVKLVGPRSRQGDQARILREAQALARLQHPNVVTLYDVGSFEERVFLAMELVDGKTLQGWSEERPRSWSEVVAVFIAAGEGLAAAHDKQLVHRDFKPANVLVGSDGRVRVTDFGLARGGPGDDIDFDIDSSVDVVSPELARIAARPPMDLAAEPEPAGLSSTEESSDSQGWDDSRTTRSGKRGSGSSRDLLGQELTRAGAVMGTPPYMAPETFRGEGGEAADQFAFAVSLYEALYRQLPFARRTMTDETRWNVRTPPADRRVPGWLHKLVLRCLACEPSDRFPSMTDVVAALRKDRTTLRRRNAATQRHSSPAMLAHDPETSNAPQPKRVFLMDDSSFALDLLRTALVANGVVVTCGRDLGDLALKGDHLDLVLMDVEMPEAFGDDIAAWLLADGLTARVYLLSGLPDDQLARRTEECGAHGFIPKRIGLEAVLAQVCTILETEATATFVTPKLPIAEFLSMAHGRLRRASAAIESGDPSPVATELHTLAGEAGLVGLTDLARYAEACQVAANAVVGATQVVIEAALAPSIATVVAELDRAGSRARIPRRAATSTTRGSARILLLDDSDFYRSTLMALLEDSGYEVVEARRLSEARHRMREGLFDLAILDLHLEDGRGSDLIPELREHAPRTRLLLLSGENANLEDADLVLLKSIDPNDLLRRIEQLLARPKRPSANP